MAAAKGNQYARKSRDWETALRRALEKHSSGMALATIAQNVVQEAINGDWRAIDEIASRLDGRAAQSIDIGGSLEHRHVNELTDERLAHIATSSSEGTADAQAGETQPSPVH
jgi:hypothetical protein